MLDLGTNAGLEALKLICQVLGQPAFVQQPVLARAQGNVPAHFFIGIRPLVSTLEAGVTPCLGFFAM